MTVPFVSFRDVDYDDQICLVSCKYTSKLQSVFGFNSSVLFRICQCWYAESRSFFFLVCIDYTDGFNFGHSICFNEQWHGYVSCVWYIEVEMLLRAVMSFVRCFEYIRIFNAGTTKPHMRNISHYFQHIYVKTYFFDYSIQFYLST